MRRFAGALLLLAACSTEADEARSLPFAEAERARGLPFLRKPAIVTRTRAEYAEESVAEVTDADVARYRTIWARLGYLPTDFDLRESVRRGVARVGAYYEPADGGRITLFDQEEHASYLVHELVHALQDQHFDLRALDDSAETTDEALAVRALAEGDASVAETRYGLEALGRDPLVYGSIELSRLQPERKAEKALSFEGVPAFLSAYVSFCYIYGSIIVADALGIYETPARWDTAASDALFRGGAPRSTEAILRMVKGVPVDPIVEVGLRTLPERLHDKYDVREVDRLGAWYSWILLRESGERKIDVAMKWDGDQLVVLGSKNPDEPPTAVVWTSAWDSQFDARFVADDLRQIHAASTEAYAIEQADNVVVLVKGALSEDEVRILANAALYDRTLGPRPSARRTTIDLEKFFSRRAPGP